MDKESESAAWVGIFPRWCHHRFFKYATAALLILTIIFLFYQVAFLLQPMLDFVSILFAPIVISFLFYYLLRPLVRWLEQKGLPRALSILLIYLIGAVLFVLFLAYIGPVAVHQLGALVETIIKTLDALKEKSKDIAIHTFQLNSPYEFEQRFFTFLQSATMVVSQNLFDILGFLARVATILAVIPFIVFYLLKDDHNFSAKFLQAIPADFSREIRKILSNIDTTLSMYINGLVMVSFSVGSLFLIGYLIIGLDYALVLSLIAFIFMTIPFLGPFMSITPALLIGWADSPWMVIKVLIVFVVVQMLESNLISPQIIGQRLHIHPLTIILLLLAAGSLYGLVGLLLATPTYAIGKVLVQNLYKIYTLRAALRKQAE